MTAKTDGGDCYAVALGLIWDIDGLLCHGTALGQGPIKGLWHDHAWIEIEYEGVTFVIDRSNGKDVCIPADVYYAIGNIKDVTRYTREETAAMVLAHDHWGPWKGEWAS